MLLTLAGCSTTGGPGSGARDPDVISREEIVENLQYNGVQLIRQLRANWLRTRSGESAFGGGGAIPSGGIRIYIDGVDQINGLDELTLIGGTQIQEMRRLDAGEATQRFGTGHTEGAILVTTVRQ